MRAGLAAAALAGCCGAVRLEVEQGTLVGKINRGTGVAAFTGVPYAQPPVGERRWQPPLPPSPYKIGVRQALTYSASCDQGNNAFTDTSTVSEDCLYLNLWLPRAGALDGPALPVMIFFYGGSWDTGSAMFPLYAGEDLAGLNNDTIVVAANYRLNAFGFLGSDRLRGEDGSTGNFGLQDQRMAMQWVRDNAARINADPARVMIFGESAGAGSVSAHLIAKRSHGLFTRAAMESGPFADWTTQPLSVAERRFDVLAGHAGCGDAADVAACLRAKNTSEIRAANHGLPSRGLCDWSPVIDGTEITARPEEVARRGEAAAVPVLLGTNKDEGSTFVSHLGTDANASDLVGWFAQYFPKNASDILAKYPPSAYAATREASAAWWAASHALGDSQMTCAARRTARLVAGPAYLYFFQHKLGLINVIEAVGKEPLGVFHGSELVLVFGHTELLISAEERELSRKVRGYWTAFAASGDPGAAGGVAWPRYANSTDQLLAIDIPLAAEAAVEHDLCDFWDALGPMNSGPVMRFPRRN